MFAGISRVSYKCSQSYITGSVVTVNRNRNRGVLLPQSIIITAMF